MELEIYLDYNMSTSTTSLYLVKHVGFKLICWCKNKVVPYTERTTIVIILINTITKNDVCAQRLVTVTLNTEKNHELKCKV
jgi:hypothetical protein